MDDWQLFHFLRPLWLLAIVPALFFLYLWWRRQRQSQGWSGVIDAKLLPHLLDARDMRERGNSLAVVGIALLVAILALAGPTWRKLPQPVQRSTDALVILYDMSRSMTVEDIKPSRLVRSRQKLIDLLERREEGTVALVAYAGDEHVVSPLTDDARTVTNLLPALSPSIMPTPGNQPIMAVERGRQLLEDADARHGHIILVTDGVPEEDIPAIESALQGSGYRLSVLGVGTAEGGPILTDRGFLRDRRGEIVIAGLDRAPLRQLAAAGGGRYVDLGLDGSDLDALLAGSEAEELRQAGSRQVDTWQDMGFWLLPLLVPVMLAGFRRGWLAGLVLLFCVPADAFGFEWRDLWASRDQQGAELLEQGEAAAAAKRFEDPDWKAAATYRAGEYGPAAELYSHSDDATGWYNQGNSLARAGALESAIAAYDEALTRDPSLEDAAFNRELVAQLLEQMQQQQQQQDSSDEGEEGESSEQNQQGQGQQSQGKSQEHSNPGEQQESEGSEQQGASSSQESEPGEEQESQQAQQGDEGEEQGEESKQATAASDEEEDGEEGEEQARENSQQPTALSREELERMLANERWLREVPDDPAGLLRRKFQYESQRRLGNRRRDDEERY